jgi:hypothetical protein
MVEAIEGRLRYLILIDLKKVENEHYTIDFIVLSPDYLQDVLDNQIKQLYPLSILIF